MGLPFFFCASGGVTLISDVTEALPSEVASSGTLIEHFLHLSQLSLWGYAGVPHPLG
jgi:hypothetical protein